MKALLCLLMAVAVSGCAAVSYSSLEDAENALSSSALSAENEAATREWIERFEKSVEGADQHFLIREVCHREGGYAWVCRGSERYNPRRPPKTLEEKVKVYRADRYICGCVKDAMEWLRR